jgi:hypothetical protein
MSSKRAIIEEFIHRVLGDKDFADKLEAACDAEEAEQIYRDAGFTETFTQEELDAELQRLKDAAAVLAPIEQGVVSDDGGTRARWVSRLSRLTSRVADVAFVPS